MDELNPVVVAVAGAVVFAFVLILVIRAIARSIEKKRAKEVMARFVGQEVLGATSNALFFGQESRGMGQVRGNSVLVLTPEQLYCEMWSPRRRFEIPVGSITEISTPESHLGKTRFSKLLKVSYENASGRDDSCAWLIRNLDTWQGALTKLIELRDGAAGDDGGDQA